MIKAFREEPLTTLFVTLLFLSIPFGLIMGLVTENSWWFAFCLPIFIFLS